MPTKLEDVSKYPDLFDALGENGWTKDELKKLAGLNLIRVLKRVEVVRDEMLETQPYEVVIPEEDLKAAGQLEECRSDYPTIEPVPTTEVPTTEAQSTEEATTEATTTLDPEPGTPPGPTVASELSTG